MLGRLRLHQLGPAAVRIVQIELPFAVAADLGFRFVFRGATRDYRLIAFLNIRHFEGDVLHCAKLAPGRRPLVDHQLDVIATRAGCAEIDPIDFRVGAAAAPEFDEAELVVIISQRRIQLFTRNGNAGVQQMDGDPFGIFKLAPRFRVLAFG